MNMSLKFVNSVEANLEAPEEYVLGNIESSQVNTVLEVTFDPIYRLLKLTHTHTLHIYTHTRPFRRTCVLARRLFSPHRDFSNLKCSLELELRADC